MCCGRRRRACPWGRWWRRCAPPTAGAAILTAAVLLIAKRLFLDKLSPRWQYGVWAILALRILLPAGLLGRALMPEGRLVLETAKLAAESRLTSALTDPYGVTEVAAPVPLLRPVEPVSVTDWLFYLYAAGIAVCLLWFLGSYLALRRRVARGRAPDRAVLARLEGVADQYGLAERTSRPALGPLPASSAIPRGWPWGPGAWRRCWR